MSGGYGVNVQVPGSDGVNVHVSGRIASCFWVIFGPSLPAFGINPRQQVRHTDSSQTQAAGTDMSPVVSSLLLGLVLCWSGTQATKPSELIKVCPRFDPSICPLAKPGPEECKTDSKCLGGKKCCCSNCGLKCVTPEQVKPGRCPPVVVRCMTPLPDPKCHSDFQCPGKKKCCEMCGISCMDPKEEPRGVCPASEVKAGRSLTCASFECSRDSDCWPDEKCCVSGDGKKCLKVSKVKPGRCPAIVVRCKTPLPDPKCHSDFHCPGKKKCCEMCGISCMDPKEEPRGVCPASEEVKAERSLTCASFECTRDSDCWPDEKCCVSGNSKKCLKPFPDVDLINVCPRFNPSICLLAKPGPEECKTDSQCLGGKKCCCSKCGLKCVTPEQVKPGRCPAIVVRCETPLPDPKCRSDLNCPGKEKCCEMCGISCQDPVEGNVGMVPA
uniref:WAP domain-containing protein n=1 Tax=Leptobrachium leishanense TaxID=445787 RepID=A0A8C5WK34_9ANUR